MSKIDYLINLYNESEHVEDVYEHPKYPLILKYALIDSRDVPEDIIKDYTVNGLISPGFCLADPMARSYVFILKDQIHEKFQRYAAIHEASESIHFNHERAIRDEFEAAENELSQSDFEEYCMMRFNTCIVTHSSIAQLTNNVSSSVKKLLGHFLKEYKDNLFTSECVFDVLNDIEFGEMERGEIVNNLNYLKNLDAVYDKDLEKRLSRVFIELKKHLNVHLDVSSKNMKILHILTSTLYKIFKRNEDKMKDRKVNCTDKNDLWRVLNNPLFKIDFKHSPLKAFRDNIFGIDTEFSAMTGNMLLRKFGDQSVSKGNYDYLLHYMEIEE
ncbi:hypothetical protein COB57_05110 [Candidatus Peregrinibacteria bacterium]|nr:MAG: hypothetical protein COB57_05110 [Candidatus Peregrinibacteria bacterium]